IRFHPNILPHEITAGSCGNRFAIVKMVIFATLCSIPVVMKQNRHHQIIINLPESLVHLPTADHIARHTSQLQKIPLKNSSHHGPLLLYVATLSKNDFQGSGAKIPATIIISAKSIDPPRLPMYVQNQPNMESLSDTVPLKVPLNINRLYPVNNSAPPIITRDNAIPNVAPATILPMPGFIAATGAAQINASITPKPI